MDPDLPKGKQYRAVCPERPLANYQKEESNAKEFKLAQIRAEAAVAREEEHLRAQIEKAKWTAVNQKVDYDQYRQLCLGANLKGMEPGQIENILQNKEDTKTRRSRRRGHRGQVAQIHEEMSEPTQPPNDRDEFDKQWRSACKDAGSKFRYLSIIPAESFERLCQVEVGFELLGEIIIALNHGWCELANEQLQEAAASTVFGILNALPTAFRFDLAVSFLSDKEKQAIQHVLEGLLKVEHIPSDEVAKLQDHFK